MDIYALLKYFGFRNWRKQADEIWAPIGLLSLQTFFCLLVSQFIIRFSYMLSQFVEEI